MNASPNSIITVAQRPAPWRGRLRVLTGLIPCISTALPLRSRPRLYGIQRSAGPRLRAGAQGMPPCLVEPRAPIDRRLAPEVCQGLAQARTAQAYARRTADDAGRRQSALAGRRPIRGGLSRCPDCVWVPVHGGRCVSHGQGAQRQSRSRYPGNTPVALVFACTAVA